MAGLTHSDRHVVRSGFVPGLKYDLWLMTFEGVYSVLPTPFTDRGDLDQASLRRVVDLFIEKGVERTDRARGDGRGRAARGRRAGAVLELVVAQAAGRVADRRGNVGGRNADLHELQPAGEGDWGGSRHGQSAADAQAEFRGGRPPLQGTGRHGRLADHRAGLSADFGLCDGTGTARAHREEIPSARTIKLEDPPTPFKTARILERPQGTKVQIFGGLGGVFLLEELMSGATGAMTGFAFPEILARIVEALPRGRARSGRRRVLSRRAADAVRVPGRDRHGDPQGSAAAARRARQRGDARARGQRWTPTHETLDRVLAWVTSQKGLEWISV